ncbi:MAG: isoprenylcysteine carboxylmethyltransferase family protein [Candidatus Thorarchaeota archaeon]|nr:isoprenylcysteine carboxylmethyltransferase family protein [Candidatus Thorarchaeota archaeon]
MGSFRYIKGFILEPFLGIFVVPVILLLFMGSNPAWNMVFPISVISTSLGLLFLFIGLVLVFTTTYHFAKFGKGSAAPWDPPEKLVVQGFYRYTRNPMVIGVLFTVLGETILFASTPLLLLFFALWIGNHVLFVKGEEPELTKKFGNQYTSYLKNVPRWVPRRTAWKPDSDD